MKEKSNARKVHKREIAIQKSNKNDKNKGYQKFVGNR